MGRRVDFVPEMDQAIIAGRQEGLSWELVGVRVGISERLARQRGVGVLRLPARVERHFTAAHLKQLAEGMRARWRDGAYRARMLSKRGKRHKAAVG